MFVASLPFFYEGQLRWAAKPVVQPNLASFGMTPSGYALLQTVLRVAGAATSCATTMLIAWRRPVDRAALFVAVLLVQFGAAPEQQWIDVLGNRWPALALIMSSLRLLGFAAVPLFFYLFPDGHWVPRWSRWLVLYWSAPLIADVFLPHPAQLLGIPEQFARAAQVIGLLALLLSFPLAQIYRYRRVAGPVQRQQIKWILLGAVVAIVPGVLGGPLILLVPALDKPGSLGYLVVNVVAQIGIMLIPLAVVIALLRYRLWDVRSSIARSSTLVSRRPSAACTCSSSAGLARCSRRAAALPSRCSRPGSSQSSSSRCATACSGASIA